MWRALEKHEKCDRSSSKEITHSGRSQAGLTGVEQEQEIVSIIESQLSERDCGRVLKQDPPPEGLTTLWDKWIKKDKSRWCNKNSDTGSQGWFEML